jgi:hypothetical protein
VRHRGSDHHSKAPVKASNGGNIASCWSLVGRAWLNLGSGGLDSSWPARPVSLGMRDLSNLIPRCASDQLFLSQLAQNWRKACQLFRLLSKIFPPAKKGKSNLIRCEGDGFHSPLASGAHLLHRSLVVACPHQHEPLRQELPSEEECTSHTT